MEKKAVDPKFMFIEALTKPRQEAYTKFVNEISKLGPEVASFDMIFLHRFVEVENYNVKKAVVRFKQCLEWRNKEKLDFKFPELPALRKAYPFSYHKVDKQGRPIYIEIDWKVNMKEVLKATTMDRFMRYCIRDYEFMIREVFPCCSKAAGHPVEGMIMIMDFGGATDPISGELYDTSMKIMDLEKLYFPKLIKVSMWKMGKMFMDKSMTERTIVLSSDYQETLLEYINAENLPVCYGGKCECKPHGCMDSFAGPYQQLYLDNLKKSSEKLEIKSLI